MMMRPWDAELLGRIIRRAKELGVCGEQADDELAVEVIIRTLESLGTLEERRTLEQVFQELKDETVALVKELHEQIATLEAENEALTREPGDEEGRPSYTCPKCGRTSYNPNDIAHRYCGACHVFEEN